MIKAVIFDCDGLMFNTEYYAKQIWHNEAAKYGITLPEDFNVRITGASGPDVIKYIESIPGLKEVRPIISAKRFDLDYWTSMGTDFLNKKGLIELFRYLRDHGFKTAICSSSGTDYLKALLSTVSEPLNYDAMIGGNMVTNGKPDPEIFLKGAECLETDPAECLVMEDSKNGIIAAQRAGMHSCFIKDLIEPDEEMEQAIEFRRDDLSQVIGLIEEMNGDEE